MVRILTVGLIATTVLLVVWGVITGYDEFLSVGRMWKTPVIKPHEHPFPVMASGSVPFNGGEAFYHASNADDLVAPADLSQAAVIHAGQMAYARFCVHCHGTNYDGYGTVGQSFAPPPRDLRSQQVQSMPVGMLFKEISFGIPNGRQPALATTMSVNDRWNVIAYVKSLKEE